jgi:predicted HicB family RNase H-like nuclease
MPNKHAWRAITPRPPDDVREAATQAAERQGTTINAVVVAFLRWYGGLTDKLPERPGRQPPAS